MSTQRGHSDVTSNSGPPPNEGTLHRARLARMIVELGGEMPLPRLGELLLPLARRRANK